MIWILIMSIAVKIKKSDSKCRSNNYDYYLDINSNDYYNYNEETFEESYYDEVDRFSNGYFINIGDNFWFEKSFDGKKFYYTQYDIDDYYYYITDYEREVSIAIPINNNDLYIWNEQKWELKYNVTKK